MLNQFWLFFLSNQTCVAAWIKAISLSGDSALLAFVSVFQSSQETGPPFLASQGKLFFPRLCLHTPMWEPVHVEPASQPAFFSPGFVFRTFSPFLLPPWCEFVCGWFSWAQGPAELWLCLLFVLTEISLWYSVVRVPWDRGPQLRSFRPGWKTANARTPGLFKPWLTEKKAAGLFCVE